MSSADYEHALYQPTQGKSRLIVRPDDKSVLTDVRQTDTRTALTRGLREYLEQLSLVADGGREIRFAKVLETYAEPEVPAFYPAAIIYAAGQGDYDAAEFSPATFDLPSRKSFRTTSEFSLRMSVEIWTTDPKERMWMAAMMEDAFDPVDWMTGVRLELPHYHNTRATYEKIDSAYLDSEGDNQRRWRKVAFTIVGNVTQIVQLGIVPRLQPRLDLRPLNSDG